MTPGDTTPSKPSKHGFLVAAAAYGLWLAFLLTMAAMQGLR